ncbi:MAG: tRNA 5-methoxyuridine(34)/uridine 5-oxyacetic acid(34) synthase CmoB [Pseudomonadota bacterium]
MQNSRLGPWLEWFCDAERLGRLQQHGDLPRWQQALDSLPRPRVDHVDLNASAVTASGEISSSDLAELEAALAELNPWRKGPFSLFGLELDTEWRSDWKWDRVAPALDSLEGRIVLDIGCGSGYHLWRMMGAGSRAALGIDPTALFGLQFAALRHFLPDLPAALLPIGLEELPPDLTGFDTVFSMGILYHRRSPLEHLELIRSLLRPGGQAIIETLVVEGDDNRVLVPEGRYAKMRNVWFIPSPPLLARWLRRCGFVEVELLDVTVTSIEEQRTTRWMTFDSLETFLDPANPDLTVEGYPAPRRAVFSCRSPSSKTKSSASSRKRNLSRKAF